MGKGGPYRVYFHAQFQAREAALLMLAGKQEGRSRRITVGADKAYDAQDFVRAARKLNVTPHLTRNENGRRSNMDGRTTRHPGYAISLSCRWLVEKTFGWLKQTGPLGRVKVRGLHKVDCVFVFGCAAPWVYDFASAPSRAQASVRRVQQELFSDQPDGLPGNDDAGAMSSWYVFSALGLYPEIPGVAGFVVGSPVFLQATIHLANGKTIRIQGHHASASNPYVTRLEVNSKAYNSPWILWKLLSNGAVVRFELGSIPSDWGTRPENRPPSFDGR